MTLLQLENLIKKELSLSDKQFHKLFGKPFELLKHEQMLKKISTDVKLVRLRSKKHLVVSCEHENLLMKIPCLVSPDCLCTNLVDGKPHCDDCEE
jgi:hypothetical protein